jgi:hypothetical protein
VIALDGTTFDLPDTASEGVTGLVELR